MSSSQPSNPTLDNYKMLIRNLREKKNEKLDIRSTISEVDFPRIGKSVRLLKDNEPGNGER